MDNGEVVNGKIVFASLVFQLFLRVMECDVTHPADLEDSPRLPGATAFGPKPPCLVKDD